MNGAGTDRARQAELTHPVWCEHP